MYPGPHDPDFGAFVADMVTALRDRGHTVTPVVIDHRTRGRLRTPGKYLSLAARALRAGRGHDVIYAHYMVPTGVIAATLGRITRTPWVITAHGQDVANLASAPLRATTAHALRGSAGLICVSNYLVDQIAGHIDTLPPVDVINMGVDADRFQPSSAAAARRALGLPAQGPLVCAVGGLTHRKDPLTLLQAVSLLRDRHPEIRLAYVGDGPLAGAVDAGARRLGMEGIVVRPGVLPHDEVSRWIAACDVLSMVSRVEPLGVVALEALASGRPVVATAVGGAREVVPADGPGRVVWPGDPEALAAALAALIDAPPRPEECRAAALAHRIDAQAARVEAVLARAAGRAEASLPNPGR